jgi:hypothetical protein
MVIREKTEGKSQWANRDWWESLELSKSLKHHQVDATYCMNRAEGTLQITVSENLERKTHLPIYKKGTQF